MHADKLSLKPANQALTGCFATNLHRLAQGMLPLRDTVNCVNSYPLGEFIFAVGGDKQAGERCCRAPVALTGSMMGPEVTSAPGPHSKADESLKSTNESKNFFKFDVHDEHGDSPQKCYKDNRVLFALAVS